MNYSRERISLRIASALETLWRVATALELSSEDQDRIEALLPDALPAHPVC